jgi:hypothetical protein
MEPSSPISAPAGYPILARDSEFIEGRLYALVQKGFVI